MAQDDEAAAAIRGTTEKGECRSHACMTMSVPNSWDLNVVKVQPSPFYMLWIAALHFVPRNDVRGECSRTASGFYCRADAVMRSAQ